MCYANVEAWMGYRTGFVSISAYAFSAATFAPPTMSIGMQITLDDLDMYFAMLRRIADEVVVEPMLQTR